MNLYNVSIGASTSIFGLIAVLGSFYAYNWHKLGVGRGFNLGVYFVFIILIIASSANIQSIDQYGHLGGFIIGGLAGLALLPREENSKIWNFIILGSVITISLYFGVLSWKLVASELKCEQFAVYPDCIICDWFYPRT